LQQLSGTIGDNPDDDCGLALLDAEDPDNADDSPSDRSIRIGTDTKAFLVTSTASDGSSEQIAIADLEEGMTADIYGSETSDGCFDAEVIIAFDLGS
jgi:hypothetical protein